MKERPIIFSGESVRAILEGRKTQTRRVVRLKTRDDVIDLEFGMLGCPRGERGEFLWVKETFATGKVGCPGGISYRADHRDPLGDGPAHPMKWRPSIYMPRSASRLTLVITGIRVERLQNISEADARAEGCRRASGACGQTVGQEGPASAREDFRGLWDSINGKKAPWASNPWVWVISFLPVHP